MLGPKLKTAMTEDKKNCTKIIKSMLVSVIDKFNEMVKADARTEKLFLTIRDGIYLIRKL